MAKRHSAKKKRRIELKKLKFTNFRTPQSHRNHKETKQPKPRNHTTNRHFRTTNRRIEYGKHGFGGLKQPKNQCDTWNSCSEMG